MVKITGVEKGSHAQKAGIIAGDDLISVNGFVIQDVLDYRFYIMEPTLVLETERNGQKMTFTVKRISTVKITGRTTFEPFLMVMPAPR